MTVLDGYAGFVPGVLASTALSAVLGPRVGRALASPTALGYVLVWSLGIIVAATLLPSYDAVFRGVAGTGACDFTRLGLPSRNQLAWPGEITLNIVLFVPLGVVAGLLSPSRGKIALVLGSVALPFVIEATQFFVTGLGRECQSGDVIDNLTGLSLGVTSGVVARWLWGMYRRAQRPHRADRDRVAGPADVAALAVIVALGAGFVALAPRAAVDPDVAYPSTAPSTAPATNRPANVPGATDPTSVRVTSIPALLRELRDDDIGEIVVADGTYLVRPASLREADSLWIGDAYAGRTRPVTVRAETAGGVVLDGGGISGFAALWFADGAHHQTWDGFVFANGLPSNAGVIMFGEGNGVAPHHVTLRNITIASTVTGRATSATAPSTDHGIYVSQAIGGPHDLLFEDITVDGTGGLASAFHFYHSDGPQLNAQDVTIRRLQVLGTQQAIILWDPTLRNITVDGARIVDALAYAVRVEAPGASGIVLRNIVSTGSGQGRGFHSSQGPAPPGVSMSNNFFR